MDTVSTVREPQGALRGVFDGESLRRPDWPGRNPYSPVGDIAYLWYAVAVTRTPHPKLISGKNLNDRPRQSYS